LSERHANRYVLLELVHDSIAAGHQRGRPVAQRVPGLYQGACRAENGGMGMAYHNQQPPVRVAPAGRFTAVPWIPPPWLLPVTIRGYLASVTVHRHDPPAATARPAPLTGSRSRSAP
jgi:hypothetical protein